MTFLKKVKENPHVIGGLIALGTTMSAFADATTPTSMLDADVTATLNDFAADIVPTVTTLIGILVPTGLTLWGIGFAIKKGLNFLQKKASKAV